MSDDATDLARTIERLRAEPSLFPEATPHPSAPELRLPDGSPAPASLRAWAAFDDHVPSPYAEPRSDVAIADEHGVLLVRPMSEILQWVCVDSVAEELADDDDALAYVRELAETHGAALPGWGVLLERETHPDRVLWFPPGGEATVIWYEHDDFERRETFASWVVSLFT